MYFLGAQLTVLEVAIFILAALAFIIAVRFFIESRKNLDEIFPGEKKPKKRSRFTLFDNLVFIKKRNFRKPKQKTSPSFYRNIKVNVDELSTPEEVKDIRTMILRQQTQLSKALEQISGLETSGPEKVKDTSSDKKLKELELTVEKKDSEIKKLKQQAEVSKKMQSHFDEMQKEFGVLQQKLEKLEQQAWEANELAIKLDHLTQSHQYLQKDVLKKEEKLRELSSENQRLYSMLSETEDKLQESNLQRQQMNKKMQFLEEMNSDMKSVSDTNRKLQNELRRIAELESMLNLITEERDELLKKKTK